MKSTDINKKFEKVNCCVILLTYNNVSKLEEILTDISQCTNNVLVINNGSTDSTTDVLKHFDKHILKPHHIEHPQGKGDALLTGFKLALSLGFSYAITIGDNEKYLEEDFEKFLDKIAHEPNSLIVGNRTEVSKKNNFNLKLSNFLYQIETGQTLPDTTCAFRLYPLKSIDNISFLSKNSGFDIEVIVKSTWKGINIAHTSTTTSATIEKPVSVNIINLALVFLALFYYRPMIFFKKLRKKNLQQIWEDLIWVKNESTLKKSISVAYGVFCGLCPFWGFHTGLAIGGALLFRLNKALTIFASNVSFPPFIPLVLYLSLQTGTIVLNEPFIEFNDLWELNFEMIKHNSYTYFVGSMVLSVSLALFSGILSYFLISKKLKIQH